MDWEKTAAVDWIQKSTTAKDVRELTQFLAQQGTFQFPTLPNGLFSAAAGEGGDYELSGYHNVWVRDNIQIAWAHLAVLNDAAIPRACVQSLTAFFAKYRHRFTDIIDGKVDPSDPMHRPHIRFDGIHLTENTEKWAHAQNDALGYFLWLSCQLISRGDLATDAADWCCWLRWCDSGKRLKSGRTKTVVIGKKYEKLRLPVLAALSPDCRYSEN